MKEITVYAKEARRRAIRGRILMKDAATMIERTAEKISPKHVPPSFLKYMQQLRKRAKALGQSKQPRQAYSAMIDTCVQCHQAHARSTLARVRYLRLK
jgi:cytochrome c553